MPVLGEHDILEAPADGVADRDHLVALLHREAAAGAEVVLHVHHDQRGLNIDGRAGLATGGGRGRGGGQHGGAGDDGAAVEGEGSGGGEFQIGHGGLLMA